MISNPFDTFQFNSNFKPSYYSSSSSRLQQLKLNNPFQRMNPSISIPLSYKTSPSSNYSPSPTKTTNFDQTKNPFNRKYLMTNNQYQAAYQQYYQTPKQPQKTNNQPSEHRNTFQSLQFLPFNSKKSDFLPQSQNQIKNKSTFNNRMGRDFNNQQIRFSEDQQQEDKLLAEMLSSDHKQSPGKLKQIQTPPKKSMQNLIASQNLLKDEVIDEIESDSKLTEKEKSKELQIKVIKSDDVVEKKGSVERKRESKGEESPVNSLNEDMFNEISGYEEVIKLEGKQYYLIPFKNQ